MAMMWRRRSGVPPPLPGGWAHGALWLIVGGCLAQNTIVLIADKEFLTPLGYFSEWISGLQTIREPSRLGIAGLVGLGILSGVAFAEISMLIRVHLSQLRVAVGLSLALAAMVILSIYQAYVSNYSTAEGQGNEIMPFEYQLRNAPAIPDSFLSILQSERAPLIELPLRDAVDPIEHARAMFHSISHWRPLLNGYSSYWPVGFPERMDIASRLPSPDALDQLVDETGLSLIWVRTQLLEPRKRAEWMSPPRSGDGRRGLTLVARKGPELLFALDPPPSAPTVE